MDFKKYNLFVVKPTPKSLPKGKTKPEPKTKLIGKGWGTKGETPLPLENKKKLDIIYAKGFAKRSRK